MARRPRGGDDRRTWLIASASSLTVVAVTAIVVLLVVVPRGPSSAAPFASSPGGTRTPGSTTPPGAGPSASDTTGSATPLPSPLSGADDSGPALVALADPNGPIDVARQLFGGSGAACGSANATYTRDCAVTHRFGARLSGLYGAGQPYEPLCRCEAAWSAVAFAAGDAGPQGGDGDHAAVTASFTIGGRHLALTVLVERTTSGWLANDTWCGAAVAQDIYVAQPQGCPAT